MKTFRDIPNALYKIARAPLRMKDHNAATWKKIAAELKRVGSTNYARLVALSFGHESGSKGQPHPYQFVDYCIERGWLERIDP